MAEPVIDFVMKEPTEGGPPTDAMEVRFAYDDRAFYIGARMFSRNSQPIQAPLGRRDNVDQAEHILIALDTFQDRRTSVVFGVTASGVRLDRFHATDTEETFDLTFDLVWDAATRQDADGWTAEILDSVRAAALQSRQRRHLGPERPAFSSDAERTGHLGAHSPHRAGLVVVVRRPARHRRRAVEPPARALALRRRRVDALSRGQRREPVHQWRQRDWPGRRRREDGARAQSHARGDDQSRLRPGGGRSGRSQPDRVRDPVSRAPALLPRRRCALQHRPPELLLLASNRRPPGRARHRRLRGLPDRDDDSHRRQA